MKRRRRLHDDTGTKMTRSKRQCCVKHVDLNTWFTPTERVQRNIVHAFQHVSGSVWFHDIERKLFDRISDTSHAYAACTSPWASNLRWIQHCAHNLLGLSLVTFHDKPSSIRRLAAYKQCKPLRDRDRVRTLSTGSGYNRCIIHQKVVVLLDTDAKPVEVLLGSYNLSNGSSRNIETMVQICDPGVATVFYDEFCRVYGIAHTFLR